MIPSELEFHDVYKAIEKDSTDKDYLSNVALAAHRAVRDVTFLESRKSSADSEFYREEGNTAYKKGLLQKALMNYNKALAFAPNGSLCLKLAYSNRSAVLFTAKKYKECQKDCIKALAINCPTPAALIKKLEKRKSQAGNEEKKSEIHLQRDEIRFQNYAEKFFKLGSHNNDIPCASDDVDVVFESRIPKVIAKRDIAAGALVALEKAFVSWAPDESEQYCSCHYCRKLSLNLFPCEGCVLAMFCSKECEESCMAEYHTDECKIAGFINGIPPSNNWIIKTVLKLKNMCASWDELIELSHYFGMNRIKRSTVNDIYDGENPLSILSFHRFLHFLDCALYKSALGCAIYLNMFQNLQSFLPEDWRKNNLATKAMARIMMYLYLYATPSMLPMVTYVVTIELIGVHNFGHWGLFPFVGKLKHSCMPNLQTLSMNNTIGLVALEQIKAGTELTISHVIHWLQIHQTNAERRILMYRNHTLICTCFVCSTSPEDRVKPTELTATQKKAIQDCFTLESCRIIGIPIETCFERIYKALTCLHDKRFSAGYAKVFQMLKRLQLYVLHNKLQNNTLSRELHE